MHCIAARLAPPLFFCAFLLASFVPPAFAGIKEDVGLVTLQTMFGNAPTGTGVPVSMTEAVVNGGYTPMTELPDFAGKHFEFRSGAAGNSAHATWVAQNFFGLTTSLAPGIDTIELYDANDYLTDGFLNAGDPNNNPRSSPQNSRVGNHSWISNGGSINGMLDVLQREDWMIERDEFIQVVGVNNGELNTNPIVSNAFNVIAVGRTDGQHAINTLPLGGIYTGYRTRPEIVAPMPVTSFSTPVVAAASALLVNLGHSTPYLSNGSISPARFPGTTVFHAETSEVIKAALLAGASRLAFNSTDGSALVDYRGDASRQSNNGLDKRFGAGQLNVHNSFSIVMEGEQNSRADGRTVDVLAAGFDYDPHFGGANGSNSSGVYDFTAGWTGQTLTASLAWNARIDIEQVKLGEYANAGTLYNLDLSLFDMTTGTPALVAASTSGNQNTENIWASLIGGRRYRLEVGRAGAQAPFDWDYGLAWSTVGTIGWRGAGRWDSASASWTRGTLPSAFVTGDHVVFSDWGLNSQVVIEGSVAPGSVLVDNNVVPYTFQGGAITGATGLVKRGSGQLTLSNSNTYAGATLIQAGKLAVTANGALGLTTGPTTVFPGGALVLQGPVNYSLPEPLTITGHGAIGQGALESLGGNSNFAGPVTINGDTTIGVTSGTTSLIGNVDMPSGAILNKTGMGTLSLRGRLNWRPASAVAVIEGTLRLEPAIGATVSIDEESPTLLIVGGAVRVNAAGEDPLTDSLDPSVHVDVINDSINGLMIDAGSVAVDQLVGGGSTYVADGAALTVNHIDQAGLSIGAGGIVALRPGQGTSVLKSLSLDLSPVLGLTGGTLLSAVDSRSLSPAGNAGLGPESTSTSGLAGSTAVASVPEPGTIALAGAALISLVLTRFRSRRGA
ncbi:MAG: autotransporter-associated beta strand repeat-containing protein [Pirellulales bacterium]